MTDNKKMPRNYNIEMDTGTKPATWVLFQNGEELQRSSDKVWLYAFAFGVMLAKYRHAVFSGGEP